jgi:translation initiation factor IF-2
MVQKKTSKTAAAADKPAAEKAPKKKKITDPAIDTAAAEKPKKRVARKPKAETPMAEASGTAAVPAVKKTRVKKAAEPKAEPKAKSPAEQGIEHKPAAPARHAVPKHTAAPAVKPAPAPVAKPVEPPKPAPAPVVEAPKPPAPAPVPVAAPVKPAFLGTIIINELTTVREIAEKLRLKPGDLLKKLLSMGSLSTINQRLDPDIATLLAHEFNYETKVASIYSEEVAECDDKDDPALLKPRPPVVTVMGHVDHGKTSLLDAIRSTDVAGGEAGGITQHIGAYRVTTNKGEVTFLDTPGHEAFTAMRSRGAKVTDLVVLVVSASDGVMPQTVEAIDHAKAAGVQIIVAINKIDIAGANPEQVKQELSKYNLTPEDWGGDTIMVNVSAKKKQNIDQLLEMILLKAEIMELKANPDCPARGAVIEAKLDPRRGPVATILVQKGTLRVGDNLVIGQTYGKIRAMIDDKGQRLDVVTPGRPAEILGINSAPQAGDQFSVVADERLARDIASSRQNRAREDAQRPRHHLSLEDISLGKVKELRVILKTDVQGSLGALRDSLEKLSTSEINLRTIHSGVGSITESDVMLAASSDALIIGFNLRPEQAAQRLAEKEGVSIKTYRIIYEVIGEIKAAMEGLLEPELKESVIGKALVRQVFKSSKAGTVAGCAVTDGKVIRGAHVRLLRDNVIIHDGIIASLRRFKDDVKEVDKGFECGISLEKFSDVKVNDVFEAYVNEKISRKLE